MILREWKRSAPGNKRTGRAVSLLPPILAVRLEVGLLVPHDAARMKGSALRTTVHSFSVKTTAYWADGQAVPPFKWVGFSCSPRNMSSEAGHKVAGAIFFDGRFLLVIKFYDDARLSSSNTNPMCEPMSSFFLGTSSMFVIGVFVDVILEFIVLLVGFIIFGFVFVCRRFIFVRLIAGFFG